MMNKTFIVILFFLIGSSQIKAADSLFIAHIGIDRGLSNNSVRCIYQDHNGFMWFGTYDGLNRYDGYQFKVFRNKLNDSNSLPHNYIYTIQEDKENNLWVGTGQGIGIYNSLTSKFSPAYYVRSDTKRTEKISININSIKRDAKGNIIIGSNGQGLLLKKNGAAAAIQIPYENGHEKNINYNVQASLLDKNERLWLFIEDVGLCTYEYATEKIRLVNSQIKSVNCMEMGTQGNFWIGNTNGLFRYDMATSSIEKVDGNVPGQLITGNVASLFLDARHNLWVGTEGGGVDIWNTVTGHVTYLLPGRDNTSLSSESVFAIYQDKDNRKWIGTLKGGIDFVDPVQKPFRSFAHNSLKTNSLIYDFVSSFYEDSSRYLWIGTDGGGLSIWNRAENSYTNFKNDPNVPTSLSSNLATSITQDHEGNIWIATYGGGISRYQKNGTFKRYKCINAIGEENKNIWLVYEDRDMNLWATTFSRGKIYKYNRQQDRFVMFDNELTDLIALKEDINGKLWAGDSHQLIQIDKHAGKHLFYEIGKPVRAIYEDKKRNLWLGTEGGGLIQFDRAKGKLIARFSDADGLCNNSVLNILEDGHGDLWLSTFDGLSKFDVTKKVFKNFNRSDGLQSNQFLYNAALRLHSGELVFGGIKGFTIFNPDSLQVASNMPPIFLTGLRVNNRPVTADSSYVTKTSGNGITELKIPYDEAVLSFDFAALEYSVPGKIAYAYYLEGWDKGWNYTGNVRTANYTRLKEGTYHLHIKNTNAGGNWNMTETPLTIIILPPWYRTWWAYLLYISIAVSLLYLYLRYRTYQTKLEYEVKLAHLETEKEKELNEKKLSFFTDMSHEFRTPLTLIINPVKDMLQGQDEKKTNDNLDIVYRNARRLLSLVDQLLLFRKADTEGNRLKISRIDYTSLCRDVYLCFVQEARTRKMEYVFECPDHVRLYGDRQKIEIALYNLLSNAVKYTPSGGYIRFEVTQNELEIITKVVDSGPGIPQDGGDKIFDKFYQAINQQSVSKPGFGIGLSLVKNVSESHKGNIKYQSELGKGTTFILTLLKGKEHFAQEFVGEEEANEPVPLANVLAEEKAEATQTEKKEELVSDHATILVMDDNDQMRQYVVSIFANKYKIYEAESAEKGLAIAREYLPDLIISDIVMEGMNGIEMCTIIKKDEALSHIPVILLTGSLSPEGRLKGIEHGADDYITKPFEKDLLVARVANLLQNRTILQNYFYNEITSQKTNLKVSAEYKSFLERCISIVEAHLDDEQFSIKTLANEIGMSHSNLYKKVKSISGQSVNAFIRYIRLRKAAELLIHTDQNVNETAFQVGISNVKYFREQFHKLFGINPSEYIKKYRKAFGKAYRVNKEVFGEEG